MQKYLTKAWKIFLSNEDNRGHTDRVNDLHKITYENVIKYTDDRIQYTYSHLQEYIGDLDGNKICKALDLGSSVGLTSFALCKLFDQVTCYGIEPEQHAIDLAETIAYHYKIDSVNFAQGFAENLPFADNYFDLVVCHEVIEHVYDVEKTIAEIARVLKPGGVLTIQAPNYIWPRETHLQIWCIPLLGKAFVKLCAKLQGKKSQLDFIDHLQFVTPKKLEKLFVKYNLTFDNLYYKKIEKILSGKSDSIKAYHKLGRLIQSMGNFLPIKKIIFLALSLGIYPSVLYRVKKL